MPMFYIPKPRRFHYEPRFYDPEKERWEALKMQHALRNEATPDVAVGDGGVQQTTDDKELEYFEQRVRSFDELSTYKKSKLTWRDMFRKREMPQFKYTPRFADSPTPTAKSDANAEERLEEARQRSIRIKRRFDVSRTLQRKQQTVWVKVALALMVFYIVYRFYGPITRFLYNIVF